MYNHRGVDKLFQRVFWQAVLKKLHVPHQKTSWPLGEEESVRKNKQQKHSPGWGVGFPRSPSLIFTGIWRVGEWFKISDPKQNDG
jgi:hypothetical protein